MALPSSKTDICNLALCRIGAKVVTLAEITADTAVTATHCNRFYEQTRDLLLRSNQFRFSRTRATLVRGSTPDFEYSYSYKLPTDFHTLISIYDSSEPDGVYKYKYTIEGDVILLNETTCDIRYVKNVTSVADFDPLFIEVLTLSLALELVMPLTQDLKLYQEVKYELFNEILPKARTIDKQEANTDGRAGKQNWNEARI